MKIANNYMQLYHKNPPPPPPPNSHTSAQFFLLFVFLSKIHHSKTRAIRVKAEV